MIQARKITLLPPPEVIASWPAPNRVNPETRGPGLLYLSFTLAILGVLVVSARIYSRIFITRAPGIDDVLIVYALAAAIALTGLVITGNIKYHSGFHVWDVDFTVAKDHRLNIWISQWLYLSSTGAIKISVLLFYRRLSVSFTKAFRWATWAGIIYNVVQLVAFGLALLLACSPVEAYWLSFDISWVIQNRGKYKCLDEGYGLTASAVFSVVGDLYAALLPTLLVSRLQLPRRQKFAVGGLFAVGYLVVGMGIGRAVLIHRTTLGTYDFTWELYELWIWALLETWVGLYAASAPALKPFFKRFLIDPITSAVGSGGSGSDHKRRTIGTGEPKRKPRSWNCLSSSDAKSPTKDDRSASRSETTMVSRAFHNQDLERGNQMVPIPARAISKGHSSDNRMVSNYEAHRFSAAPPPTAARGHHNRSNSQPSRSSPAPSDGSQSHYRAASAASTYRHIHSSERHVSAQLKSLDVTQLNATSRSRTPSRAAVKSPSPLPSAGQTQLHTRGSNDTIGRAIRSEYEDAALWPDPLRRKNTNGSDSSAHWLMTPARSGPFRPDDRPVSWRVLTEEEQTDENHLFQPVESRLHRATSNRASHGSVVSSRANADHSAGNDSLALPAMIRPLSRDPATEIMHVVVRQSQGQSQRQHDQLPTLGNHGTRSISFLFAPPF